MQIRGMRLVAIVFCALAFMSTDLDAQKRKKTSAAKSNAAAAKELLAAETMLFEGNLKEASEGFTKILRANRRNTNAAYLLSVARGLSGDKTSLERVLAFEDAKSKTDRFYYYWLGKLYSKEYRFDEAVDIWDKFLGMRLGSDERAKKVRGEVATFVDFYKNSGNYEIHQLEAPINSEFAELTPTYDRETKELLFASARGSSPNSESFSIYHSIKRDGEWTDTRTIDILGKFDRQTANLEVVDEDGKLFIYRPDKGGDLFFSETRNGQWLKPVEFDSKVSNTHLESHFFINEHEDRIIFASHKNEKKKGLDLYQSFKDPKNGKWTKPQPFADIINSDMDEDSPYLTPDESTLYFSSKGHGSIGGYDIFKTVFDSATFTWSEPVSLGFPINSPDDEIHFKINPGGASGYFSSNRLHTMGDYDIYFFWEVQKLDIEGRIFDAITRESIEDAKITFIPSQYEDQHFRTVSGNRGKYNVTIFSDETYRVKITKDDETLYDDEFEIHETGQLATRYIKDFVLHNSGLGITPAEISLAQNINKPIRTISTNPKAIVKSTPKQQANTLQNRISQIRQVLNKPPQNQPNNNKTTPKSTETVQQPKTNPVTQQRNIVKNETTPVQTPVETVVKPKGEVITNPEIKTAPVVTYNVGRKVTQRNLYFRKGSNKLSNTNIRVLKELVKLLQSNPELIVEVAGHTDNEGSDQSNLEFSQMRSEIVKSWLLEAGISPDRLIAKGYGESRPLASNDDEKSGRELNRRVEFFKIQ